MTHAATKAILLLLMLAWSGIVAADDFKPAYLQLTQVDDSTYDVMWKLPALDEDTTLKISPRFPEGTRELSRPSSLFSGGMAVQRWSIHVPGGLEGELIAIDGLAESRIDALVRVERLDGSQQVGRILPGKDQFKVKPDRGSFEVALTYAVIGIEHILLGFDHLLFVLALVMIVRDVRKLIYTITAFTVAHSITLSLATLGVLQVPGPPVEAIIALSIVFVAAEILRLRQGHVGLAARKPWVVAFAFGLLHGLGFAGALAEVGLPHNSVPMSLLFFNVGVEIGQVVFVGALLLVHRLLARLVGPRLELERLTPLPVYLVGGIASFWVIERVAGFIA